MASGIWILLVIPAIVALIFGVWVLYSIIIDVSERDFSLSLVGIDAIRDKATFIFSWQR